MNNNDNFKFIGTPLLNFGFEVEPILQKVKVKIGATFQDKYESLFINNVTNSNQKSLFYKNYVYFDLEYFFKKMLDIWDVVSKPFYKNDIISKDVDFLIENKINILKFYWINSNELILESNNKKINFGNETILAIETIYETINQLSYDLKDDNFLKLNWDLSSHLVNFPQIPVENMNMENIDKNIEYNIAKWYANKLNIDIQSYIDTSIYVLVKQYLFAIKKDKKYPEPDFFEYNPQYVNKDIDMNILNENMLFLVENKLFENIEEIKNQAIFTKNHDSRQLFFYQNKNLEEKIKNFII